MRPYFPNMVATVITLTLLLTALALTSPTGPKLSSTEELADSTFNSTLFTPTSEHAAFTTHTSPTPEDDGNHIIITLENDVKFQTCAPDLGNPAICTLAYVEKSTWGGWGAFWVYDHQCNWMGANDHVARNWLAARWSLASKLRWYVDIRITTAWTEKKTKGVEIWYGSNYLEPFYRPLFPRSKYVYLAQYASKSEPGQVYAVWRTPFICS